MKTFGYSMQNDRQIRYDNLDRSLYNQLELMEPSIKGCISCGTCAQHVLVLNLKAFHCGKSFFRFVEERTAKSLKTYIHVCFVENAC